MVANHCGETAKVTHLFMDEVVEAARVDRNLSSSYM